MQVKKSEIVLRKGLKMTNKEIADSLGLSTKQLTEGMKRFGLIPNSSNEDIIDWVDDMQNMLLSKTEEVTTEVTSEQEEVSNLEA